MSYLTITNNNILKFFFHILFIITIITKSFCKPEVILPTKLVKTPEMGAMMGNLGNMMGQMTQNLNNTRTKTK